MNEQEKFEAWCATKLFPASWREDTGANVSWLACAEQKDKDIAELNDDCERWSKETFEQHNHIQKLVDEIAELKDYVEALELHISLIKAGVKLP